MRNLLQMVGLTALVTTGCQSMKAPRQPAALPLRYHDARYGLTFNLPVDWRRCSALHQQWDAPLYSADYQTEVGRERGPIIVLRNPRWKMDEGQRLSSWLSRYSMDYGEDSEVEHKSIQEADEAVRQMGTNTIPFLLRRVGAYDSRVKLKLIDLIGRQRLVFVHFIPARTLNDEAARAFRILHTNASNAAPSLMKIYRQNISMESLCSAASSLGSLGPAASNAIPLLLATALNTNVNGVGWDAELDRDVRREAAISALGRIPSEPETVVPALIGLLHGPDPEIRCSAACTLGSFGCDANSAMPALLQLFEDEPGNTHDSNWRRIMIAKAIMNIETAVATADGGGR